ncbi:site-2 protease family protein [Acetivibrio mesophilus]|uniref:Site-2 protease family protein n=1 Tax=Acetivibrio mesophilus TaxID=2487273 RepID=A0A4Q0I277_9FIRM|nr:site-2 protease family protein [Acetivibrio mesophilus]ODM25467.1 peptidase [Clostridium sp. Bc-iso-3]RXE58303.1 site-2 protease family protein [Acetivibrio mesophilus]HHV28859.1 site-2 protease family protein [Clostridium sp.]
MLFQEFQNNPELIIYWFMVFAFSISVHESAHAYIAYRLGDSTAKDKGRITLDPLKHLDLFGTLMILISFIGWAKPVPINPSNFKNKKTGTLLVSLAGPLSNLILAVLFAIPLTFVTLKYFPLEDNPLSPVVIIYNFASYGFFMNTILAVFNFLPLPPLDGSKVFTAFLPSKYYFKVMQYRNAAFIILVVLSYTGWLGKIITPVIDVVQSAIFFVIVPIMKLIV